jgi:hypothetical protein
MTCHRKPERGRSRRASRLVCRAPRRIPAPGIINSASCLACRVGMDGGHCVWTTLWQTKGLRLEDEPIHAAEDPGMSPVKPRPFQRRGASADIDHPLVHRPAMPLFPDPRRNLVTDDGGADPCGACRRIVDRLRAEACGYCRSNSVSESHAGGACKRWAIAARDEQLAKERRRQSPSSTAGAFS